MGAVSERAKANKRKADKERREWYKSRGICPRCKTKFCKPGYVHCEDCISKYLIDKRRRDPTGEKEKAYCKERYQRLREQGICPVCGKRKAEDGVRVCAICRQATLDSKRKSSIIQRIDKEVEEIRRANGKQ